MLNGDVNTSTNAKEFEGENNETLLLWKKNFLLTFEKLYPVAYAMSPILFLFFRNVIFFYLI